MIITESSAFLQKRNVKNAVKRDSTVQTDDDIEDSIEENVEIRDFTGDSRDDTRDGGKSKSFANCQVHNINIVLYIFLY